MKSISLIQEEAISIKKRLKESVNFRRDNPGGSWLKDKQEHANKHYNTRKTTGAVTGSFDKLVHLPVTHLHKIHGELGEHHYRDRSDKLKNLEKEIGHPKNFDSKKHPPLVGVNHKGEAHVIEGNHRIAYAKKHGISHMHVEYRYFNGGEDVKGEHHPETIKKLHKE